MKLPGTNGHLKWNGWLNMATQAINVASMLIELDGVP